jgi:hypothetical protein
MATTTDERKTVTREQLIKNLNEDLAREYQAVIAYVVYSQVLKGAQYMSIAKELEKHAGQELSGDGARRTGSRFVAALTRARRTSKMDSYAAARCRWKRFFTVAGNDRTLR